MKTLILVLGLLTITTVSFSQDASSYLENREHLFLQQKDITLTDRDYSQANGEILPALVQKEISGNLMVLTYSTHRNINDDNRVRVMDRLKVSVPSIVAISSVGKEIEVSFLMTVTPDDLTELFRLTGFKGYKIMNY